MILDRPPEYEDSNSFYYKKWFGNVWRFLQGVFQLSVFTAKGDILVATASATGARKAVGSNGTYLSADSTQTDGLRYARASPSGHIFGLTLSNNATATKLDVAAGNCRDSTDVTEIVLSSAITAGLIQTSGSWAAGSTQNKLDTGSRSNNTWYHVVAIKKDSDGSGDWLFSLSATSPTMPTGYTYFRRIGSVLTDGSGNIISFIQVGDIFRWKVPPLDASNATLSSTYVNLTLSVPPDVRVLAYGNCVEPNSNNVIQIRPPDASDASPSTTASPLGTIWASNLASGGKWLCLTNTSKQVAWASSGVAQAGFYLVTEGWTDTRGKDS